MFFWTITSINLLQWRTELKKKKDLRMDISLLLKIKKKNPSLLLCVEKSAFFFLDYRFRTDAIQFALVLLGREPTLLPGR